MSGDQADLSVRVVPDGAAADQSVFMVNQQVVAGSPSPGDVPVVQADGTLAWGAAQGGTSVPGTTIVRAFPFAFDTSGLLTGAALYTPTIGDLILDGWIDLITAWNGTTPLGDFGTFTGNFGLFADVGVNATRMDGAASEPASNHGLAMNTVGVFSAPVSLGANVIAESSPSAAAWQVRVTAANPIKVVVSSNGQKGGVDPGATQGSAVLYLVTVTPAT